MQLSIGIKKEVMETERYLKAKKLEERMNWLQDFVRDTRPEHCNGLGIVNKRMGTNEPMSYEYTLHSTHNSNTGDQDLIMRIGIKAAHDEAVRLRNEVMEEFKEL